MLKLLRKNQYLTARYICKFLNFPWPEKKGYVDNIRSDFLKTHYKNGLGPKRPNFHKRRWYVKGIPSLDLDRAVKEGWNRTKSKNHMLTWKDPLGRMEWFPSTGRVNLYMRSLINKNPITQGHVYGLFCRGFTYTDLIKDSKDLDLILSRIRVKGAHATFDTGIKLPNNRIDFFKESNGLVIKTGDRSHPTAIEVEFCYPDWAERLEFQHERIIEFFNPRKIRLDKKIGIV